MFVTVGQFGARRPEDGGLPANPAVDDDVGSLDKLEKPPPVVFVVRVQHRAALVRVVHGERDAGAFERRQVVATRATARGLHFEHVGTQVGEQAGHGVGNPTGQVEDAHRVEQPGGHLLTVFVGQPNAHLPKPVRPEILTS